MVRDFCLTQTMWATLQITLDHFKTTVFSREYAPQWNLLCSSAKKTFREQWIWICAHVHVPVEFMRSFIHCFFLRLNYNQLTSWCAKHYTWLLMGTLFNWNFSWQTGKTPSIQSDRKHSINIWPRKAQKNDQGSNSLHSSCVVTSEYTYGIFDTQ